MKFLKFCLPVLVAGIVAVGCNQGTTDRASNDKANTPNATGTNTNAVSDAEITAAVKTKFMTDENVSARKIEVETNDGVVTLRGKVASASEAERAEELAKSADGVRMVHSYLKSDVSENSDSDMGHNDSKVEKSVSDVGQKVEKGLHDVADAGSDAAITAQIKWKLAKDKMVQASDIDVNTKDGHVTLTGTVNSRQEKERAIQLARSVNDVISVHSNLQVH